MNSKIILLNLYFKFIFMNNSNYLLDYSYPVLIHIFMAEFLGLTYSPFIKNRIL